jgi:hypothetical protein
VTAQGSYRNNTNVRQDSDVDISVVCTDAIFTDFTLAGGLTKEDLGFTDSPYLYSQYKDEVGQALVSHFGAAAITRGNKAFDVHQNTYRIDADVVPCLEHRRYMPDRSYVTGTELQPDRGGRIINWPEQNYRNGVDKNDATGRRFKTVVRILKRLRIYMEEQAIAEAEPIPSYLIECLVWNVPNKGLGFPTLYSDMQFCLAHLYNNLMADQGCTEWGEINELKYLFRPSQPWSHSAAFAFVSAAWDFVGFK